MPRLSARRKAAILEAYVRYGSVRTTAFVMGASLLTVRRIAKAAGVLKPHARPWSTIPSADELRRLLAELGTYQAVADACGCHRNTIHNRLYGRTQ